MTTGRSRSVTHPATYPCSSPQLITVKWPGAHDFRETVWCSVPTVWRPDDVPHSPAALADSPPACSGNFIPRAQTRMLERPKEVGLRTGWLR